MPKVKVTLSSEQDFKVEVSQELYDLITKRLAKSVTEVFSNLEIEEIEQELLKFTAPLVEGKTFPIEKPTVSDWSVEKS